MTPDLDLAVRSALVACFPKDAEHFSHQRWWHSPHQWSVIACGQNGRVIAGLCAVERTIIAGERKLRIAGVGNVCTIPEFRGKHLIDRIMKIALDEARSRGHDAGLLFCKPELEKVYRRMGWKRFHGTVTMDDGSGKRTTLPDKNIAMTIPVLAGAFPEGDVDLQGRDW